MHPRRDSTARSRQFGDELRAKRKAADLKGTQLAEMLGWSPAKINKLESGERGTSDVDVAVYLNSCGVIGDELRRLLALNRETSRRAWLQFVGAEPADRVRTLAAEEARAVAITAYHCLLVPGLLQTRDYASSVVRHGLEHRLGRQELLRRSDSPDVTFFIDEQVLRRPVGGAAVMHDQLMHLLFVSATVRIVPVGPVVHEGIREGNFVLLEDADQRSVVYLESKVANVFLEDPEHVATYRSTASALSDLALGAEESRVFVMGLADEYGVSNGAHDVAQEQLQRRQR
jgi:transcriptional regulator with XRE-family HTH domain